jgi:cell volume regulation protein A
MGELGDFAAIIAVASAGLALAVGWSAAGRRLPVPAPLIFLVIAAVASDLVPALGAGLDERDVERIGVVALIAILFDGGLRIGTRRLRTAVLEIGLLGIAGTFLTAGLVTVAAHVVLGLGLKQAAIVGAALAPTDPAVLFASLADLRIGGRSGPILEGEAGTNDPVAIALMIAVLEGTGRAFVTELVLGLAVGLVVGIAGGLALRRIMLRPSFATPAMYPLRTLAAAGLVYGAAGLLHGSGFLAVFVAGLLAADTPAPFRAEIHAFHDALGGLGELTVFIALGLIIDTRALIDTGDWIDGIVIGLILIVLIRPAVVLGLLAPTRTTRSERRFIAWCGVKGAVPILLAALALLDNADGASRAFNIVVTAVVVSVLVQAAPIVPVARRLGVPIRHRPFEPFQLPVRLARRPRGIRRVTVTAGSQADGSLVRDLELTDGEWVSLVIRDGRALPATGSTRIVGGDELVLIERPGSRSRASRPARGRGPRTGGLHGPEGLGGSEASGPDGGVEAGDGAREERGGDAEGDAGEGNRDGFVLSCGVGGGDDRAQGDAGGAAEQCQHEGFREELAPDVPAGGAKRAAQPDLGPPLEHGDHHHVCDADAADEECDGPEPEQQ